MRVLAKIPQRLRSLFRRRGLDCQLEDEFRFHLDQPVGEEIGSGLAPEEAQFAKWEACSTFRRKAAISAA